MASQAKAMALAEGISLRKAYAAVQAEGAAKTS